MGLAGKEGTPLAKRLAGLGQSRSVVAGLAGDDSAMTTRITLQAPEEVRKALGPVVDETVKKILDEAEQGARDVIRPLLEAVAPTLKEGRLDIALDFRGPSQARTYTIVGGAAIKGGATLEKELKAVLKKAPAEVTDLIGVDAAKSGNVNIHKLNIGKGLDEQARKNLGDEWLYFAVRDDALFVALGEGGLAALKDAVGTTPKAGPVAQADLSMRRLADLMAAQRKAAPEAAREAFGKAGGTDKVFVRVESGKELHFKLGMKGPVLRFFHLLDEAEKKKD
jgi:hypothetical protein